MKPGFWKFHSAPHCLLLPEPQWTPKAERLNFPMICFVAIELELRSALKDGQPLKTNLVNVAELLN
jgi:hypothetical protein